MTRAKLHISTLLLALVLAVLLSFSAVMCLADAFSLSFDRLHLLLVCGAASFAAASSMLPRKVWVTALPLFAIWFGIMVWLREPLQQSFWAVLHAITTEYASVYGGIAVMGQAGNGLLFLAFLSVPFGWLTAWIVCREGNALFLLLACLPILLLCLIIVDIAPVLWLVVMTFVLLVLLLTRFVRERDANEGSRLAWWLLLPAMILVTAITVLWPPADYERTDWSERLRTAAESGLQADTLQELTETIVPSTPRWNRGLRQVDLSRLGPKAMTGRSVLESKSNQSRYYLRSVSLGIYENNAWYAADAGTEVFSPNPLLAGQGSTETDVVEIRTVRVEDSLYTPYYPASVPETAELVDDAYVKNSGNLRSYTVTRSKSSLGAPTAGYDIYVNQIYKQIPEELRQSLQDYLSEAGLQNASPQELASFVRSSAVYDLNTPRIPANKDFVLYFLQESHRGYCVHFATAAVMLLRTMDIPARYVTGYSVNGEQGEWVAVTEDDAHAWVEYYVNGTGWVPLDPTPSAEETEQVQTPTTEQTPGEVPENQEQVPEPEKTPKPQEQESAGPSVKPQSGSFSWSWLWLLPAALLLVLLRYQLGLQRKKDRCRRGHPNKRAMGYWRWLVQLARQEGTSVEEELICLAEKARFSQHTLTEEELQQLQIALEQRIARLKQYPFGKQLWFRFGLILY